MIACVPMSGLLDQQRCNWVINSYFNSIFIVDRLSGIEGKEFLLATAIHPSSVEILRINSHTKSTLEKLFLFYYIMTEIYLLYL